MPRRISQSPDPFLTPGSHTIRSDGNLPYACSLFQFWRVIRSHFRATLLLT